MTDELLPATRRALLHRIATGQRDGRAVSLVGGLVRDGELAWFGGRGTVAGAEPSADTQYRIGSLTKTFAAVLVLRLRDAGRLDLGDRLDQHLPGTPIGSARIAELLAHSSGLAAETPPPWWERSSGEVRPELADVFWSEPNRHPAGRRFHYSNVGFGVLGALIEQLHGRPWGDVLREEVLLPLGMPRTTAMPVAPHANGYAVHPWADVVLPEPAPDAGLLQPAGQLWSTIEDLARFAAFLAEGRDGVLAASTLAEMREAEVAMSGPEWDSSYGLGLQLQRANGRRLAGHTGSMPGFVATLWISVEDGLAGVALSNVTSGPAIAGIAADLIDIVATAEPKLPEPWRPLPSADPQLLELTGPWYWGAAPFALHLRADRELELVSLSGRGRASRFRATEDGTWVGLDGYYLGEILRLGAGAPVRHFDIGSFLFTREPYDPAAPVPGGVDPDGWRPSAP